MSDTIAAIATPLGVGGIGIVRCSGPKAKDIAQSVTNVTLKPRFAHYASFYDHDGSLIDEGLILYFKAPHSFTGEDVIEFQGHGGPVVLDRLLQRLLMSGARAARPGEFSERAFLNDKIDLTQAEAISDLIHSQTEQAARAAARSLQGAFRDAIQDLQQQLIHIRTYVEASIDFPEEEIDFLSDNALLKSFEKLKINFESIHARAKNGVRMQEGLRLVLVGRPNTGKSTLLNQLSGKPAAIVTDVPGTTRDVMRENIALRGIPIQVIDTAGLRETTCPIESEGIRRAWLEAESADAIIVLVDCREVEEASALISEIHTRLLKPGKIVVVANKIDTLMLPAASDHYDKYPLLYLSAKTADGIPELINTIVGTESHSEGAGEFSARRRHLVALSECESALLQAEKHLKNRQGELLAEECRLAQHALSEITGDYSSDDLLGEIFSNFCIGK